MDRIPELSNDAASYVIGPGAEDREAVIEAIWLEILGFGGYGRDEDFFAAGGDSIAAMRMILEVETAFGVLLPPDLLYRHSTITAIAAFVGGIAPAVPAHPTAQLESQLASLVRDWPGTRLEPFGLLRGHNVSGTQRPWFWCVQLGEEARLLAALLGADRPVYAMRSGHLLMSYTPEQTAALVRRYMREVLAADPAGPYHLGGICQGSVVAVEMARQLQQMGREVALVALLDTSFWDAFGRRPYAGKTLCITGTTSRYNPFRRFRTPELGWRKVMQGGVRLAVLPTDHYGFLWPPCDAETARTLQDAAAWAQEPAEASPPAGPLPYAGYLMEIAVPKLAPLAPGAGRRVVVTVRNTSPVAWPAESGLALGNHWLRPDGEIAIWADGRTPLPRTVGPGETCDIPLVIRAPADPGRYLVEFDMVDEGVAWFKDRYAVSTPAPIEVRWPPGPYAEIISYLLNREG